MEKENLLMAVQIALMDYKERHNGFAPKKLFINYPALLVLDSKSYVLVLQGRDVVATLCGIPVVTYMGDGCDDPEFYFSDMEE